MRFDCCDLQANRKNVRLSYKRKTYVTFSIALMVASCRSPGGIARGKKTGSNYGHGKTVRYDCDAEYTLEGKNILTCDDENGTTIPQTAEVQMFSDR